MAKISGNTFIEVRKDSVGDYIFIDSLLGGRLEPFPMPADWLCQSAFTKNLILEKCKKPSGDAYWKKLTQEEWKNVRKNFNINPVSSVTPTIKAPIVKPQIITKLLSPDPILDYNYSDQEIRMIIENAMDLKPSKVFIKDVKWKYLVHSILRAQNILIVGDSGAGKTVTAKLVAKALRRPFEYFNLGATQDARATLIGNTHADASGTMFDESLFVKMIRTPYAIILLDELTRGSHDAWNILMPVLDPSQRYLRLDEKSGQETVFVAEGVSFISTANIGRKFTATKMLDDALFERNQIIEMDVLSEQDEQALLEIMYPTLGKDYTSAIAKIAGTSRAEVRMDVPVCERYISTRMDVRLAQLITDGFTMPEAYDACVFPFFSTDGAATSERTFITQIAQQHMILPTVVNPATAQASTKGLFTTAEMNQATP